MALRKPWFENYVLAMSQSLACATCESGECLWNESNSMPWKADFFLEAQVPELLDHFGSEVLVRKYMPCEVKSLQTMDFFRAC